MGFPSAPVHEEDIRCLRHCYDRTDMHALLPAAALERTLIASLDRAVPVAAGAAPAATPTHRVPLAASW